MCRSSFLPFNFRNGRDLTVNAAISVALQQTQPGGQWFAVSSIRADPKNQTSSPARSPFLFSFLFSPRLPVKVNEATRQRQAETLVSRHVSSSQSSIHNQPTQDTRLKKITDTFTQNRGVRTQHRSRS